MALTMPEDFARRMLLTLPGAREIDGEVYLLATRLDFAMINGELEINFSYHDKQLYKVRLPMQTGATMSFSPPAFFPVKVTIE